MTKLVNEQACMTIGSKETLAHASRIRSLNERVDNLSALTALAGENHVWLSNKAKELSASVPDGGVSFSLRQTRFGYENILSGPRMMIRVMDCQLIRSSSASL